MTSPPGHHLRARNSTILPEHTSTVLMGTLSEGLSLSERVARTIRTLPGQNVRPPWDLALLSFASR